MASKDKHLDKANRNASFAASLALDNQANIDWAVTAYFYSGLHFVEAYLAQAGFSASLHDTHAKRDRLVTVEAMLKPIKNEYADLKNFGLRARYECSPIKASVVRAEVQPAFEAIREHLKAEL